MRDVTLLCPACGTEVAAGLLACPGCQKLVHADRLKGLAAAADRAGRDGDVGAALVAWREALELLPPGSRQYALVEARIAEQARRADGAGGPLAGPGAAPGHWPGRAGVAGVGAAGLFLWKFKFLAVLLITKAKFLLLGLTKASTFLSMLAFFGVYWAAFGWGFALGLVGSIYVHEMGHVFVLNRYGVKASAPMFIPGLGALIRLRQVLGDVRQDARVGLAGPEWGLARGLACLAGSVALGSPMLAAVAKLGAFINLFNLIPIGSLDGGRAFRALSRPQRWLAAAVVGLAWSLTDENFLVLLVLGAAFLAAADAAPAEPDRGVLTRYAGLVAAFSALMMIPVPV